MFFLFSRKRHFQATFSATLLFSTALSIPSPAQTTYEVDDAVSLANAFAGAASGDIIRFKTPGMVIAAGAPITVATGNLSIDGNDGTWQSATGERMLIVADPLMQGGDLGSIRNLTLTGADNTDGSGGVIMVSGSITGGLDTVRFADNRVSADHAWGGALHVARNFAGGINNSTLQGNSAVAPTDISSVIGAAAGGALYIEGSLSGGITKSVLQDNSVSGHAGVGGAIYIGTAKLDGGIGDSIIRDNRAEGTFAQGGALFAGGGISGDITGSTFTANSASGTYAAEGGALVVNEGLTGSILNSVFENNTARTGGSGSASGGAIRIRNDFAGGIIGSTFRNNGITSGDFGEGGAILIDNALTGGIAISLFESNSAISSRHAYGGAFSASSLSNGITSSVFSGNNAIANDLAAGGAVFIRNELNGGISGSTFAGNAAKGLDASGGALAVNCRACLGGIFNGGIADTTFTGNSVMGGFHASGGAVYVNGDFNGGIANSAFIDNSASGSEAMGGAIHAAGDFSGGISGSGFKGNSVEGYNAYGGAIMVTGKFMQGEFKGNIRSSRFSDNRAVATVTGGAAVGGAFDVGSGLNAGIFTGDITGSLFENNMAAAPAADGRAYGGGAGFGVFNGNIIESLFQGNSATADGEGGQGYGGAITVFGGYTGTIRDSVFRDNHATTAGGAVFLDTGDDWNTHDLVLTSSAGGVTLFEGNTDASGANSLFFGRIRDTPSLQSPSLTLTGAGILELRDPIRAEMNNGQTLTVTRNISDGDGQVNWGGRNRLTVDGGTANVVFDSGRTTLLENYALVAGANTALNIGFGQNHVLSLQFSGRDPNLAVFDFSNGSPASTMTITPGSTAIVQPRSLLVYSGRYLFADGIGVSQAMVDGFSVQNNAYFKAAFLSDPATGQVWIDTTYNPYVDSGPNAPRAEESLDQWLRFTKPGTRLSDAGFNALLADLDSVPPEAAMTMGLISSRIHDRAADTALAVMFESPPAGPVSGDSLRGVYTGLAAKTPETLPVANPAAPTPSLRLWASYIGDFIRADSSKGYSGYNSDSNGLLMGATWDSDDAWLVGGYAGFSHSEMDFKHLRADADSDAGHFGAAVRYTAPFGLKLTLDGAYSTFDNTLRRNPAGLGASKGEFDQQIYSLGFTAVYELTPWQGGRLIPFAGIRRTWLDQDGFVESGGALAARVGDTSLQGLATTIGARISQDITIGENIMLTPSLSLAWRHEFGDRQLSATASFLEPVITGSALHAYDVYSYPLSRDSARIGAGLDAAFGATNGQQWKLKALYNLDVSNNAREHSGYLKAEYRF